jgi:hypothetical protein
MSESTVMARPFENRDTQRASQVLITALRGSLEERFDEGSENEQNPIPTGG